MARSPQLQFHTMEVMTSEAGGEQAQQQQVFLYKLVQGRSGPSFGVFCARLCGVPAQVG
jgi:DNA mismatch repair ATPase MutS